MVAGVAINGLPLPAIATARSGVKPVVRHRPTGRAPFAPIRSCSFSLVSGMNGNPLRSPGAQVRILLGRPSRPDQWPLTCGNVLLTPAGRMQPDAAIGGRTRGFRE